MFKILIVERIELLYCARQQQEVKQDEAKITNWNFCAFLVVVGKGRTRNIKNGFNCLCS
jgi:hypothetical protein